MNKYFLRSSPKMAPTKFIIFYVRKNLFFKTFFYVNSNKGNFWEGRCGWLFQVEAFSSFSYQHGLLVGFNLLSVKRPDYHRSYLSLLYPSRSPPTNYSILLFQITPPGYTKANLPNVYSLGSPSWI